VSSTPAQPAAGGAAPPGISALSGLSAAEVADRLAMHPHREGGYFRETYRSPLQTATEAGRRWFCTSILYMLTATDPSRFHRLRFDEVWFFHAGSPVEMVFLDPPETLIVGPEAPQALAPGGRWMAARIAARPGTASPPVAGPEWALVGCVVSPGFEYEDFEAGKQGDLLVTHPEAADYIRALS
jgi:uncharacterized protein